MMCNLFTGFQLPVNPVKNVNPVVVKNWARFPSMAGFGYRLSNRIVGILFNDNTNMCFSSDQRLV